MVLLGWGPFVFAAGELDYERMSRKAGGRWKDHELFGRAPAGQFLGPALREVEVHSTLYPDYCDGDVRGQIEAMMAAAEAGESHILVSGFGDVSADTFRLEMVGDTVSHIGVGGAPAKIEAQFRFRRLAGPTAPAVSAWPA